MIDENQPDYERGDFLVAADPRRRPGGGQRSPSASGSGSARRCGCRFATARSADEDLREALRRTGRRRSAPTRAGGRAAVHLQRPRLAHVRRPDHDAAALEDALGRARRRLLLRRRDRPGRRPQLPARLHGDDRRLPAPSRWTRRCASSSPGRSPRTSAPATSPPRRPSRRRPAAGRGSSRSRPGVVFGLDVGGEVFSPGRAPTSFERAGAGGRVARRRPGRRRRRRRAGARALLAAERTALNLLGHLSGVATLTARFVGAVDGHRRGDPRHPQDDAGPAGAREGGGRGRRRAQPPHGPLRRDPDQGEPHRARRRPRRGGRRGARSAQPELEVEVECRDADEVAEALGAGADRLLLDNMDADALRAAVALARRGVGRPGIDARGLGRRHARERAPRSPRPASTSSRSAR